MDKRIILEVNDSFNFYEPADNFKKDEWYKKYIYSYESKIPIIGGELYYYNLQQDLNRYFPFFSRVEKRKVRCLVLKRITNKDKLISRGEKPSLHIDENYLVLKNFPMASFVSLLSNIGENISIPIVDGTDYKKNIDITIIRKFSNIDILVKNLKEYDLDLIKEEREIDMLVISNK